MTNNLAFLHSHWNIIKRLFCRILYWNLRFWFNVSLFFQRVNKKTEKVSLNLTTPIHWLPYKISVKLQLVKYPSRGWFSYLLYTYLNLNLRLTSFNFITNQFDSNYMVNLAIVMGWIFHKGSQPHKPYEWQDVVTIGNKNEFCQVVIEI